MGRMDEAPPYTDLWRQEHARVLEILEGADLDDPDAPDGESLLPEDQVKRDLRMALQMLYHQPEAPFARRLLERARSVARGALMGGLYETEPHFARFPLNRARVARGLTYIDLLLGRDLDRERLLDAALDLKAWCQRRAPWDDVLQAQWMAVIRMHMLAGELTLTRWFLELHPELRHHAEEQEILRRLVGAALEMREPNPTLVQDFDRYFDHIRHPHSRAEGYRETVELRLELAMLRELYVTSPDGTLDMRTVLCSVARDRGPG